MANLFTSFNSGSTFASTHVVAPAQDKTGSVLDTIASGVYTIGDYIQSKADRLHGRADARLEAAGLEIFGNTKPSRYAEVKTVEKEVKVEVPVIDKAAEEKLAVTESELTAVKQEYADYKVKAEAEAEIMQKEIHRLDSAAKTWQSKATIFQNELNSANARIKVLEEEKVQLTGKVANLDAQMADVMAQLKAMASAPATGTPAPQPEAPKAEAKEETPKRSAAANGARRRAANKLPKKGAKKLNEGQTISLADIRNLKLTPEQQAEMDNQFDDID